MVCGSLPSAFLGAWKASVYLHQAEAGTFEATDVCEVWTVAHRGYSGGRRLDAWAYADRATAERGAAELALSCGLDEDAAAVALFDSGDHAGVVARYFGKEPRASFWRFKNVRSCSIRRRSWSGQARNGWARPWGDRHVIEDLSMKDQAAQYKREWLLTGALAWGQRVTSAVLFKAGCSPGAQEWDQLIWCRERLGCSIACGNAIGPG